MDGDARAKTITGVKVAVDNAAFKFDVLYDYLVPERFSQYAVPGARVVVPFGRGNAPRMGIILQTDEVGEDSKELLFAEESPVLSEEFVQLIFTLKDYTFCTYSDALHTVLPKFSRAQPEKTPRGYTLTDIYSGHTETVFAPVQGITGLTSRQSQVLESMNGREYTFSELAELSGVSRETVSRMETAGALLRRTRIKQLQTEDATPTEDIPPLTPHQQTAYDQINEYMRANPSGKLLLHGVTSSGKTLVYIKLIEQCVAEGRGVLVLVPEIAIATQMIRRLKSMFGARVGVIHSALSDTERQIQWIGIKSGQQNIVVGTRSAVFAPVVNMGLIIADEEQEQTFTSEQSPRYNAIAIARTRAAQNGAFMLLASATPSVESYHKAKTGGMGLVTMTERYRNIPLPTVHMADMQRELTAGNCSAISRRLADALQLRLQKGEQSLLLLNRRGYRTVTLCSECRTVLKCKNCDVPLVLHKNSGLMLCHYCGASVPAPTQCEHCGGTLRYTGIGTQRIEEELAQLFPQARILRMDLDSTSRKHELEDRLAAFGRGDYDILVGTQMIAKGLDFPNVTLVGVCGIDSLLMMPSYRAFERTFSMLTQVVGRSGRGEREGEAIIQTLDPNNPVMDYARRQDYEAFYNEEIVLRKAHLYPPFCAMCTIGFASEDDKRAREAAESFSRLLISAQDGSVPMRLLGPSEFRIAVVNNLHRWRLTIKCRGDFAFRELLRSAAREYVKLPQAADVRFFVDFSSDNDS